MSWCKSSANAALQKKPCSGVVAKLQERRWQSDQRFAEMFYRSRVEQGHGGRQKLKQKCNSGELRQQLSTRYLARRERTGWRWRSDRYLRKFRSRLN